MKARLGPAKAEALRQNVLGDQAKTQREVSTLAKITKGKIETTKADARKIIVLTKSNPHAAGSRRANWFKQIKT
jgi:hypothetical protein